jgi:hypothetical protein
MCSYPENKNSAQPIDHGQKKNARRSFIMIGCFFFALFFLTQWNLLQGAFERDEGEYAYSAWLLHSGGMPYKEAFIQKPPMIIYVYWLAQFISADSVVPVRIFASLFVLITILLSAFIAYKRFGKIAGYAVLFILPIILSMPSISPYAANTEKFMILPMIGVLFLQALKPDKAEPLSAFTAGALAAVAILFKPLCAAVLFGIFLYWSWRIVSQEKKFKPLLKAIFWWSLGFFVSSFLICLPIIIGGAWDAMWQSVVTFNQYYSQALGWNPEDFFSQMLKLLKNAWPLFIFVLVVLFRRKNHWWFEITLLFLGYCSAFKDQNGHYYVMLMPIWALIAGSAIAGGVDWISRKSVDKKSLVAWTAICATCMILFWPLRRQVSTPSDDLLFHLHFGNPFYESLIVARHIDSLTKANDKVFVAGSEPQILFYAKRRSPTRFTIMYPLMMSTPLAEKYQNEVMNSLETTPPSCIVISNSVYDWLRNAQSPDIIIPYINQILSQYYILTGAWLRKGVELGAWKEQISPEERQFATLLVYKRNSRP